MTMMTPQESYQEFERHLRAAVFEQSEQLDHHPNRDGKPWSFELTAVVCGVVRWIDENGNDQVGLLDGSRPLAISVVSNGKLGPKFTLSQALAQTIAREFSGIGTARNVDPADDMAAS